MNKEFKLKAKELRSRFMELPQLDRIEARQRQSAIEKHWRIPVGLKIIPLLFLLGSGFCFALAFLGAGQYGDPWFIEFFELSLSLFEGFFNWLIALLVAKSALILFLNRDMKKLIEEYYPKLKKKRCKK